MNNILYKYELRVDLLYVDNEIRNCVQLGNTPMNRQQNIKLHRGVDNQIRFRVMNLDRKPVSVDHLSIRARLVNKENGERVFDRYANMSSKLGDFWLPIYEGDLLNIAPGLYDLVVTGEEPFVPQLEIGENMQTPFYVDGAHNIVAKVEVVAGADPTPWPSTILTPNNWTIRSEPGFPLSYYSSAIPGSRLRNHVNAVHTFAAYTTGFTGTLQVRATLELQPPDNPNDFFPVDITSGTNIIEFENYTGVTAHTFEANYMWLIFVYTKDPSVINNGTLNQVVIR